MSEQIEGAAPRGIATPTKRRSGSTDTRRRNRRDKEEAALRILAERWPNTFRLIGERQPLKVGLYRDVTAELGGSLAGWRIRGAFRRYTDSIAYLRAMKEGTSRIDITGVPAGTVTAEEEANAKERLERIEAARKQRKRLKLVAPEAQPRAAP